MRVSNKSNNNNMRCNNNASYYKNDKYNANN